MERAEVVRGFGYRRRSAVAALVGLGVAGSAAWGQTPLPVVTTTSDLRSLVEAVGGERVAASHLAPPEADVEHYLPRPRDVERLRGAALAVRVGADFDLWFDPLAKRAGNPELARGGLRHVDASRAVALLEVRGAAVGPGDGHAHGAGNPHYWLDPANAAAITATLLEALARLDGAGAAYFEARRIALLDRLAARLPEWQALLAPLRGTALVAQHNTWAYFARRFRLEFAGFIEPRPGVPASPAHLARLRELVRERRVRIIVRQPHESARDAEFVAAPTRARVIVIAASVGALPEAADYVALIDQAVRTLARAHAASV